MREKLYNMIFGRDLELQERMLRVVILTGGILAIMGLLESAFLMDASGIILPLVIVIGAMALAIWAMIKGHKMEIPTVVVGLVVVVIVFPAMFMQSGGVEGGAAVWFVLGFFCVFMIFTGKRLIFFTVLSLIVDATIYIFSYYNPDLVVALPNRFAEYADSFFSIMAVGVAVGIIFKYQVKLYKVEREIAIAQKEELEKISNSKNEFFANMSHEIRTPINTIIGLNEMILRENTEEAIREYAQNIQVASRLLLDLVNDILDLSQMEIKRMEIVPVEYETKALFEELVDLTQVRMQEKKLEFVVDVDKNLPSVLQGDERRIKQILLNILSNAVKYTKEGSVTLSAHGDVDENGELVLAITVADTGNGIRKEDLEHLYDAYLRVDTRKNSTVEGTGLGLAITKQLVDLMGGEINVDSIYTKGSVFTVTIKQGIVEHTPIGEVAFLEKKNREQNYYTQSFEAPEARVLVVDDNEMNAMVVTKLLKATKMDVEIARSGMECLEKTRKKYYHVILMDCMMPKMSGTETVSRLRKQENGLCRESSVIMLTANVLTGTMAQNQDKGFDGYLEKPTRPDRLEAEILKFLPDEIVEYRADTAEKSEVGSELRQLAQRKRKKIYVTSECACDLPKELAEKYDIQFMYLYIKTEKGRFADTREIDSSHMVQCLLQNNSRVITTSVSVEEYEAFFAEMLTQAEHVIHISMASQVGKSYDVAMHAAKGFDHVHIIDSGQLSGGEGLLTLYAAKLAMDGYGVREICDEMEAIKGRIESKVLLPDSRTYGQNGYMKKFMMKFCEAFRLHPVVRLQQSRCVVVGTHVGNIEAARRRFICQHLRRKKKIDTDIVIITYVGCSVKEQEQIREEVLKCVPFKQVIMHRTSFSIACNVGLGTIGIAYYTRQ